MPIQAKVVNQFKEIEHENYLYYPGDTYPAEGYEATQERVDFLSNVHPTYKKIYLADVQEIESTNDDDQTANNDNDISNKFPKHVGGGQYLLSNGEKVKGKEAAEIAEEILEKTEE